MILLMLRDGSMAEIPQGHDIIHRKQTLLCIDRAGEVITSLNATEVLAYTCSEAAARRFVNDAQELESELQEEADEASGRHNPAVEVTAPKGERHAADYARH